MFFPGESLADYSLWGHRESDTTERLHFHFSLSCTGEGNGNPLQCSCLENPRDGGAWWAAVTGVAQSQTRLKRLSSSSSSMTDKVEKNEQFQMPMKTWSNRNSHFWWECKMVEPLWKLSSFLQIYTNPNPVIQQLNYLVFTYLFIK